MDLGCGITFDIFTRDFHGSLFFKSLLIYTKKREKKIQCDDLEDGYNIGKRIVI